MHEPSKYMRTALHGTTVAISYPFPNDHASKLYVEYFFVKKVKDAPLLTPEDGLKEINKSKETFKVQI